MGTYYEDEHSNATDGGFKVHGFLQWAIKAKITLN
jgi:hypothetical protein